MPTYDYRCTKCRQAFAVEQSMRDAPLKKCSKCGGRLEKLLPRSVNLIFKGSGFYATDYRKGGRPAAEAKAKAKAKADSAKQGTGEKEGK